LLTLKIKDNEINESSQKFKFSWKFYGFGDDNSEVELAQRDMFYITIGKSFEVGYKVSASSYSAHYTWEIAPRIKNSLSQVRITLKASVEYKN
jgi:hypothetical protein